MKIAILSNGYGEDAIAANLAIQLKKQYPSATILVCPLVGNGHHYDIKGFVPMLQNPSFPSGGFIRTLSDLLKDIFSGLISHIIRQVFILKKICLDVDFAICCGDVFCLVMGRFATKSIYFLPTAKSDTFMSHSWIEKRIISKCSLLSFPRDNITTKAFDQDLLPAKFLGNPMMDNLITNTQIVSAKSDQTIIGILPGSRQEAVKNLQFILEVCKRLAEKENCIFLCAVSKNFSFSDLELSLQWSQQSHPYGCLATDHKSGISVLFTYEFLAVINQSSLVIGLAGTANEQACFLNVPVVCFEGAGPQSSLKRFKEQQSFLGHY